MRTKEETQGNRKSVSGILSCYCCDIRTNQAVVGSDCFENLFRYISSHGTETLCGFHLSTGDESKTLLSPSINELLAAASYYTSSFPDIWSSIYLHPYSLLKCQPIVNPNLFCRPRSHAFNNWSNSLQNTKKTVRVICFVCARFLSLF